MRVWREAGALVASVLLLAVGPSFAQEDSGGRAENRCITCHADRESKILDVEVFQSTDIHARSGLSCADCHGGDPSSDDPEVSMGEKAGFRGAPDPLDIPEFCGRCHSDPNYMRRFNPRLSVDQLTQYRTSGHGVRNAAGDPNGATCVSCHGVHGIRTASEPKSPTHPLNVGETCGTCHSDEKLMAPYGLRADQVDHYYTSVHWAMMHDQGDLSAPTCNDCHGNHGALPPEVESISGVCGQCHVKNREFFVQSPKKEIFDENGFPECETCHGNHAVQSPSTAWIGLDEGAICAECHEDDGSPASNSILLIRESLLGLQEKIESSKARMEEATQRGMYLTDAEFVWRDARQKLLEGRAAVHLFDPRAVREKTSKGLELAAEVEAKSNRALADYRFRRSGLLVSTLIITIFALLLYLKIRTFDKE